MKASITDVMYGRVNDTIREDALTLRHAITQSLDAVFEWYNWHVSSISWRHILTTSAILLSTTVAFTACGDDDSDDEASSTSGHLQMTWQGVPQDFNESSVSRMPAEPVFVENQTIRMPMRVSQGGRSVRVRVSNLFGTTPLVIGGIHFANSAGGAAIVPSSDRALTFNGQSGVTVPAGETVWTDEVDYELAARSVVDVSLYVAARTQVATLHTLGMRDTYLATGDVMSAETITTETTRTNYLWVTGIETRNDNPDNQVIVAFGDSITDGARSTPNTDSRYPDYLDRRVAADPDLQGWSVVNAGISGNRILTDTTGPNGVSRFERDVLDVAGVDKVIILLGINDIGRPYSNITHRNTLDATRVCPEGELEPPMDDITAACNDDDNPSGTNGEPVRTADELTAGIQQMVDAAHARDVEVFLATLTPFGGAAYYTTEGETKRVAYNTWIREGSHGADGVIDFDVIARDPAEPRQFLLDYDSGDNLHPQDGGYEAMANAIDLSLFKN